MLGGGGQWGLAGNNTRPLTHSAGRLHRSLRLLVFDDDSSRLEVPRYSNSIYLTAKMPDVDVLGLQIGGVTHVASLIFITLSPRSALNLPLQLRGELRCGEVPGVLLSRLMRGPVPSMSSQESEFLSEVLLLKILWRVRMNGLSRGESEVLFRLLSETSLSLRLSARVSLVGRILQP
jgi:hypothetical protein